MKKHVYKPGDRVRILRPRLIQRVGYPLHYKDLRAEAAVLLGKLDAALLTLKHARYPDLVEGLAKALVLDRGYGGSKRSIHYFPISEPVPDNSLWAALSTDYDEDYNLVPKPDPTGKIAIVTSKYVRKTGTRVGGYLNDDWESGHREWENGYLADEETHIILGTNYGDIEICDVELVMAAS